ncbi:MAG TPA: hypothetical protein VI980_03995 [Acidimicrobiia bacterium]|nr:hypothetical protein [Acidimicrobiia bacterium]
MRRMPNPWIAIPALVMGALAGALGWMVTAVSCQSREAEASLTSCPGWAALVSAISFLVVTFGMVLILALVYRSLAEWNEKKGPNIESRR